MVSKYVKVIIVIISLLLVSSIYILYNNNQILKDKLSTVLSNEKAFIAENSSLKNESRAFKFTIEQLNYYNDSILEKMNNVKKELRIKDNDLKQMQYLLSVSTKKRHSTFYRYNI